MKKVDYSGNIKKFIDQYDKVDFEIWNATSGEIVAVRKYIRDHYLVEQKYRCAYCRIEKKEAHGMTWDIEHILPKSIFPAFLFESENLAIACKECNGPKDDTDILRSSRKTHKALPNRKEDYTIVHPHFDIYSDHFEIINLNGKRSYRMRNNDKARRTYIACNLSRFDYKYGEWESFDEAIVCIFSDFLDNCPKDSNPNEIKRMLGHMKFAVNTDF